LQSLLGEKPIAEVKKKMKSYLIFMAGFLTGLFISALMSMSKISELSEDDEIQIYKHISEQNIKIPHEKSKSKEDLN
jgi:hypothetical protein